MRQKAQVGSVPTGYAALSYFTATRVDNVQEKEWQHLIQEEAEAGVEEGDRDGTAWSMT